jgi:hypothetical protein
MQVRATRGRERDVDVVQAMERHGQDARRQPAPAAVARVQGGMGQQQAGDQVGQGRDENDYHRSSFA